MPLPTPKKGESKNDFVSRCVEFIKEENPDIDNNKAVAIAYKQWKEYKG